VTVPHRLLYALSALSLGACGQADDSALRDDEQDQSIDQQFFAAREAVCGEYTAPGYEAVPLEKVEDILQLRHNGERIMAHLSPEHHCAERKVDDTRTCYRLYVSDIGVGGAVNFCTDRRGNVSDFELEE
jgi:hypothetical protein